MKDNKLIAEFMELHDEISLDSIAGNIHSWSDSPFFYITEDSKEKVIEGITEYSKYHTSWDWLMPVVEKIESMGFWFNRVNGDITIVGDYDREHTEFTNVNTPMSSGGIDMYYQAIVEFIQEYRLTPKEVV
tara:strand:- start:64 stop:456 length:393 start_codon:yes stop_codon:yes gene_type:complete